MFGVERQIIVLSSHRQPVILHRAISKGIYMWFFPPNTSHWSQPLDNLLFANLKKNFARVKEEIDYLRLFTKPNLFSLISETLEAAVKSFSVTVTAAAFRNTGVFPFNATRIQTLARQHYLQMTNDGSTNIGVEDQIVRRVVSIIEESWKRHSAEAQGRASQMETVKTRVKTNVLFDPREILEESRKRKEREQKEKEEKEKERKRKREERQKEKEKEAQEKEARKQLREQKKRERDLEKQCREEERLGRQCKAGCGAQWRTTGRGWTGCEYCDVFWVCPTCATKKTHLKCLALTKKHVENVKNKCYFMTSVCYFLTPTQNCHVRKFQEKILFSPCPRRLANESNERMRKRKRKRKKESTNKL